VSSISTGRTLGSMTISAILPRSGYGRTGSVRSISSAAASPAKTSVAPEKARASKVAGPVSGRNITGSSEKSDPVGSLLRTCLLSDIEARTGYCPTWKQQATPSGRSWWVLSMPGRTIGGNGPGLWPTPTRNSGGRTLTNGMNISHGKGMRWGIQLEQCVRLYPTSQAQDSKHGAPTAWERIHRKQSHLHSVVNGRLNPTWVEWLMGFPLGWTDLDASETLSSRKSLK
jgi:hypothetical protein